MAQFEIEFSNEKEFLIGFENTEEFNASLSENIIIVDEDAIPVYTGETEITPRTHSNILLDTKNKRLLSDINVLKVPYFETSNVSGITVYIGGDE